MRVFNEDKTKELEDIDLSKGRLVNDKLLIKHIEYQPAIPEEHHYEVIRRYENGGEDLSTSGGGHSKGSLVYDKSGGSFLLHSLPRFPTRLIGNKVLTKLPNNAGRYGQHFLCISVNKINAEKIVQLLNYINVFINKSVNKDRVNLYSNNWVINLIQNSYSYSKYDILI